MTDESDLYVTITLIPFGEPPYSYDDRWLRLRTEFENTARRRLPVLQRPPGPPGQKGALQDAITVAVAAVPALHELRRIMELWLKRPRVREIRYEIVDEAGRHTTRTMSASKPFDEKWLVAMGNLSGGSHLPEDSDSVKEKT